MQNAPQQQAGESQLTDISLDIPQVKPLAKNVSSMPVSDWRGSITLINEVGGRNTVSVQEHGDWDSVREKIRPKRPISLSSVNAAPVFTPCDPLGGMSSLLVVAVILKDKDELFDVLREMEGVTCAAYHNNISDHAEQTGLTVTFVVPLNREVGHDEYTDTYNGFVQQYLGALSIESAIFADARMDHPHAVWCSDPKGTTQSEKWVLNGGVISVDALIAIARTFRETRSGAVLQATEVMDATEFTETVEFTCIEPIGDLSAAGCTSLVTQPNEPVVVLNDDAVIASLAAMSTLDYERARVVQAKIMGCRPAALDTLVKQARNAEAAAAPKLPFPEVEPYPEPIDPVQLFNEMLSTFRRFIVFDAEQAVAATLLAMLTWLISVVKVAPLAIFNAPERECGKTQLLDVFGRLSCKPLFAANITTAVLFRVIDKHQPTILIDEVDTFIRENEELKGLINAGHTRTSALVWRIVGENHEPTSFSVWAPKILAGITLEKHLPDSTMSRGIEIRLRRKMPHEKVERLRNADPEVFNVIASKLARFSQDYSDQVKNARPELPDELSDRAQDNWDPLLAIAKCIGPECTEQALAAALKLSGSHNKLVSTGNELLSDIKHVFDTKRVTKISTVQLIDALCIDEENGWATYNRGKPLSPRQLAKQLASYGISSKTVRLGHENTPKGFDADQFADVFARYLSPTSKMPQQRNDDSEALSGMASGVADHTQHSCNEDATGGVAANLPHNSICNTAATLEPLQDMACGGVAAEVECSEGGEYQSLDAHIDDAF